MNILLTGASGMVGEGVLHECVQDNRIEKIIVLGRKPCGYVHEKIEELLVPDFLQLDTIKQHLIKIDSCLFCAGISSVGISKEAYYTHTYTTTMHVANTVLSLNKLMTFCYISGAGTSSKENSRMHWANVKGKTENDLMKLPFKAVYNFRPGALLPTKGLNNTLSYYKTWGWLIRFAKLIIPNSGTTLVQLGKAMIHVSINDYHKHVLEVKDIILASKT